MPGKYGSYIQASITTDNKEVRVILKSQKIVTTNF